MEEEIIYVNVKMPENLIDALDEMVRDDDSDRSKFIRQLVRQEYERRNPSHKRTNPRMRSAVPA